MSVLVKDRNLSKCQVVVSAVELKAKIHELSIRDLGIKDLERIARKKYMCGKDPEEMLPKYVLELHQAKQRLHFLSDELIANTRAANRIKMTDIRKCNLRLDYQERAVNNCEMLIGKLQDIVDFFLVDLSTYRQYIEAIDNEIDLLKNWIQLTNKTKKGLRL